MIRIGYLKQLQGFEKPIKISLKTQNKLQKKLKNSLKKLNQFFSISYFN
jgi:hypothetical protein